MTKLTNTEWEMLKQLPPVDRAIMFATVKHSGQSRKGSSVPYITHVVEAMEIVAHMTEDEELRAAAVLHDTLEDTATNREELVEFFGERVAALVAAESENKRPDQPEEDTWMIRKQETVKHLSQASTEIKMLALGDKLSNARAMSRDYQEVGEKLWERFNQKDPVMQGMYYGLLANAFSTDEELRKTQAYKEYIALCSDLFSREYDGEGHLIKEADGDEEPEKCQDMSAADSPMLTDKDRTISDPVALLCDIRLYPENYYPLVDHHTRIFERRTEDGEVNIGWNIGLLEGKRPWFVECWSTEQITLLTFFISTEGLKDKTPEELVTMLEQAGLVGFKDENSRHTQVVTFTDRNENEFFSINITVGVEEETYLTYEGVSLLSYDILNELNEQSDPDDPSGQNG